MHAAAVRGRAEIMQLLLSTRVPSLIRFSVTMSSNSSNSSSLSAGGFEAESPWFFFRQKHGLHCENLGRCSLGILILTLVSVGHHALCVRKEMVMPTFSTKMCAAPCLPSPQKADANTSDDAGTTCFHFAADLGHARVASLGWIYELPTCSQQQLFHTFWSKPDSMSRSQLWSWKQKNKFSQEFPGWFSRYHLLRAGGDPSIRNGFGSRRLFWVGRMELIL